MIVRLVTISPLIAGAIALSACGDDGTGSSASSITPTEPRTTAVSTPVPSPTARATPTPSASALLTPSPVRTPTLYPSPPPVPDDWLTFTDPGGLFAFCYPPGWTTGPGSSAVFSFDTTIVTPAAGYSLPDETTKVEVLNGDITQLTACGALVKDEVSGELVAEPGAAEWPLAGASGWLSVSQPNENVSEFLITSITATYQQRCFTVTGFFNQAAPNVQTFLQIAASFRFTF
jgi:hypothetical protein